MEDKNNSIDTQTPQTPAQVKREIADEYRDLATVLEQTARVVADAAKPSGIFGRWFHTSTS